MKVINVSMKHINLILLASLLLISSFSISAFAVVTIETRYTSEDATLFANSGCNVAFGVNSVTLMGNASVNYGTLNETALQICGAWGGGGCGSYQMWDLNTYYKFNTNINKVLTGIVFTTGISSRNNLGTSTLNKTLYYFPNNWNESTVTYNTKVNSLGTITNGSTFSFANVTSENLLYINPAFIQALYNSSQITIGNDGACSGSQCICSGGSAGNQRDQYTHEYLSSASAQLILQENDYTTGQSTFTFGIFGGTAYFDFETQSGAFADFTGSDFSWNNVTNTITALHGVTVAPYLAEQTTDNTLDLASCSSLTGYGTSYSSINFPNGNYDIICFKLSNQHNGNNFYGAIKVINNSASQFEYYYALYSPAYTTIGTPSVSPEVPRGKQDITISWSSSQSLTSGLRWWYVLANNDTSGIATISNDTVSSLNHALTIAGGDVPQFSTIFYYVYGNAPDNTTYTSQTYNFSVGSDIGSQTLDSRYTNNSNYSSAFVLIPIDTGGYPVGLSMDCKITTSGGFTRGYLPPSEHYYVESLGVTAGAWIIYTNPSAIGQYYNVSCISNTNIYQNETHASVLITQLPMIKYLTIGSGEACSPVLYDFSRTNCEVNMKLKNVTWYCAYDVNRCLSFNQDGSCYQYGVYIGYECTSCSIIPNGFTCNATQNIGRVDNGTTDVSGGIGASLGNIFKINSASALAFLTCMVFMAICLGVGALIKNGIIILFGVLSGMMGFFFLGWLPIWIPLLLGIVSAFLVSKFVAGQTSGNSG